MAHVHLDAVRAKLEEMRQLETTLMAFVESCNEVCCEGPTRQCAIIEDLSCLPKVKVTASSQGCCEAGPKSVKRPKTAKSILPEKRWA
jgi:hypothetical protein